MGPIIYGGFLAVYGLYIILKKRAWIQGESGGGFWATGSNKIIVGLIMLIGGGVLIVWEITLELR